MESLGLLRKWKEKEESDRVGCDLNTEAKDIKPKNRDLNQIFQTTHGISKNSQTNQQNQNFLQFQTCYPPQNPFNFAPQYPFNWNPQYPQYPQAIFSQQQILPHFFPPFQAHFPYAENTKPRRKSLVIPKFHSSSESESHSCDESELKGTNILKKKDLLMKLMKELKKKDILDLNDLSHSLEKVTNEKSNNTTSSNDNEEKRDKDNDKNINIITSKVQIALILIIN